MFSDRDLAEEYALENPLAPKNRLLQPDRNTDRDCLAVGDSKDHPPRMWVGGAEMNESIVRDIAMADLLPND